MAVKALLPADLDRTWAALTAPTALARWSGHDSPMAGVRGGFRQPVVEAKEDRARLVVRWPTSTGNVVDEVLVSPADGGTTLRWSLTGDPPARDLALDDVAYVRAWRLHDTLAGRGWADPQDYAAPVRQAVSRVLDVRATPSRVWQVLTDPVLVGKWLSGQTGAIEVVEGGMFDSGWRSADGEPTGPGRILRLVPEQLLETTWFLQDTDPTDSALSLLLAPRPGGTRVTLHHGPWPADWDASGYALGWLCCLLSIRGLAEDSWAVRPR